MQSVSLLEFLRTGHLGFLRLGMSLQQVISLLGEPDKSSLIDFRRLKPLIIKYGDIELYFPKHKRHIKMIYMDNFKTPCGGSRLDLDPWILRGGVARSEVESHLEQVGIPFSRLPRRIDENVELVMESGVRMLFIEKPEEFDPTVGLYAISLSNSPAN